MVLLKKNVGVFKLIKCQRITHYILLILTTEMRDLRMVFDSSLPTSGCSLFGFTTGDYITPRLWQKNPNFTKQTKQTVHIDLFSNCKLKLSAFERRWQNSDTTTQPELT